MASTQPIGRPLPWPQAPIRARHPRWPAWFAPRASAQVIRSAFPPRRHGRRTWFAGGIGCLVFVFYLVAAVVAAYFTLIAAVLALVWAAQLAVLTGWALYAAGWYATAGLRSLRH